jgi:3-methyladenine DNA glycosylase AlkD
MPNEWTVGDVLKRLERLGSEKNRAGMARYGINTDRAYGVSVREIRLIAREIKRDHALAQQLWATNRHEARILASFIADPTAMTRADCDAWVADVNSWDLCDQLSKTFEATPFRDELIADWIADSREFVRREGFAVLVARTVHDKKTPDQTFLPYLKLIERHAADDRNFVRKAVNWALRQIGKRSLALHGPALDLAETLAMSDDRTARWIGRDAARELKSPAVIEALQRKTKA